MLAYQIDPLARTIISFGHNETTVEILGYLGAEKYEIIRRGHFLFKGDALYVDAGYRQRPCIPRLGMFSFKGLSGLIVGRALISGHTVDGEMCDPRTPIEKVRDLVAWS